MPSQSRRPPPRKQTRAGGQAASSQTKVVAAVLATLLVVGVAAVSALILTGGDSGKRTGSSGRCADVKAPAKQGEQFSAAPPKSLSEDTSWTATVRTNCGDVVLELDGAKAPQTVASFLYLASKKWFDDTACLRVTTTDIFVLQCGDPTGTSQGGPGYQFGMENAPKDGRYPAGTLAMARTQDPNSNGSQFFVVYADTTIADPTGYSIFGRVVKGLDVVQYVAKQGAPGGDGKPNQPIVIESVTVSKGAPSP